MIRVILKIVGVQNTSEPHIFPVFPNTQRIDPIRVKALVIEWQANASVGVVD